MRLYEIVYIFDASMDEDAINTRLDRFHGLATGEGGEVTAVDHWGIRQLAYPIRKKNAGYYVVAQFNADAENLVEFERVLKLDEELMRFLIVLNEGEPTSGMSIVTQRPEREEEDEDDEDEEDEDDDEESPPEFAGGRGRRRRHEGPAIELLNYKDVSTLARFLTEQGKILPKRTTKVTSRFQRQLGTAVKRARYLALVPYMRHQEG